MTYQLLDDRTHCRCENVLIKTGMYDILKTKNKTRDFNAYARNIIIVVSMVIIMSMFYISGENIAVKNRNRQIDVVTYDYIRIYIYIYVYQ